MPRPRRALETIDKLMLALRRGYFGFTSTECELMADDLSYARDHFASVTARRRVQQQNKDKNSAIHAVMQEDIRRK